VKAALALALVAMMGAATAQAQAPEAPLERVVVYPITPPPSEALPPPPSLSEAAPPESYAATSRWAIAPGGPEGIVDPILITHPDHDLLIAGTVVLTVSYTIASVLSTMFGTLYGCSYWGSSCEPGLGALGLVPIGHFAAGFSGTGGAAAAFITGGVFAPFEVVGLILLIAGAGHRHPLLVPRQRAGGLELATF
jgi:hypothetical protein